MDELIDRLEKAERELLKLGQHYTRATERQRIAGKVEGVRLAISYVHRCRSPWWKFVDHITLQSVPTRTRLAEAEAAAIELEKPAFNVITPPGISPQTVLHGRGHRVLWSDANNFCTVAPRDNEYLIDMTLEQQLFPCAECQARMICCEGDTVSCRLCGAEWAYDQWFAMTFADTRQ